MQCNKNLEFRIIWPKNEKKMTFETKIIVKTQNKNSIFSFKNMRNGHVKRASENNAKCIEIPNLLINIII